MTEVVSMPKLTQYLWLVDDIDHEFAMILTAKEYNVAIINELWPLIFKMGGYLKADVAQNI